MANHGGSAGIIPDVVKTGFNKPMTYGHETRYNHLVLLGIFYISVRYPSKNIFRVGIDKSCKKIYGMISREDPAIDPLTNTEFYFSYLTGENGSESNNIIYSVDLESYSENCGKKVIETDCLQVEPGYDCAVLNKEWHIFYDMEKDPVYISPCDYQSKLNMSKMLSYFCKKETNRPRLIDVLNYGDDWNQFILDTPGSSKRWLYGCGENYQMIVGQKGKLLNYRICKASCKENSKYCVNKDGEILENKTVYTFDNGKKIILDHPLGIDSTKEIVWEGDCGPGYIEKNLFGKTKTRKKCRFRKSELV